MSLFVYYCKTSDREQVGLMAGDDQAKLRKEVLNDERGRVLFEEINLEADGNCRAELPVLMIPYMRMDGISTIVDEIIEKSVRLGKREANRKKKKSK